MALLASRNLSQTKSNAISRLFEWDKTKTFCYNEINERNFQFAMQMSRTTNVVEGPFPTERGCTSKLHCGGALSKMHTV